jgi:2-oxoglutarate dehydrogenase E2 component (dihydrolipoamide succinyltransferase)
MIELKIPRPGESINEVVLSKWFVEDGDIVDKNQEVGEIESDKATLPLVAPESGKITFSVQVGTTIPVGIVACTIDETVQKSKKETSKTDKQEAKPSAQKEIQETVKDTPPVAQKAQDDTKYKDVKVTPVARNIMEEKGLSVDDIINGLRKLGKDEVQSVIDGIGKRQIAPKSNEITRTENREQLSQLRKKLSKRLVAVKNETAMLTTFNEIDMSEVMAMRSKFQKQFTEKHGIKLGFMSFFTKAASLALQKYPKVNSSIDGDDLVTPSFTDIGIAVQAGKGLMVPIIRNVETLSLADIELTLAKLAEKARANRLGIEEMTGGTFTITNGGVFGSLLSTPIINPPQAAILGMHNIVERPVAINGKVEIRPMMYVALSYDHRIIDGKDSVSFLVRIKELIESPYKLAFESSTIENLLLDL